MTILQIKAVFVLGCLLLILCLGLTLRTCGKHAATAATDLKTARAVIKTERANAAVAQDTEARVDRETLQVESATRTATHEIDAIRAKPRATKPPTNDEPWPSSIDPADKCDADCARIVQLAAQARAAALDAGTRLQAARAGD